MNWKIDLREITLNAPQEHQEIEYKREIYGLRISVICLLMFQKEKI